LAFSLPTWAQNSLKERQSSRGRLDLHGDPLPEGAVARLGTVRFRHPGAVHAVAFSQDGKLLAASSDDLIRVVIWERATGRKLREIRLAGLASPPNHLRFSPDAKRLYGSYHYGRGSALFAWDVETGASLPCPLTQAWLLGYAQEGREAILLHKETDIVRFDLDKGKELERHPNPAGSISTAARLGDQLLVPQFDGQAVRMWDVARNKQLWSVAATRNKNYPGLPMVFSSDGKLFAVEAPPRVISICESASGKLLRRIEADVGNIYWSLAISPNARTVAGSNWDGMLRLWDLESGRESVQIPSIEGRVTHVFFAPDSKTFATGDGNNAHAVLLWDTATGRRIEPFSGHTSPVSSVAFSPDGGTMATSSWLRGDPVVRLWDPQTGRLLRSLRTPDRHGVSAVAFSPDGKTLAACGWAEKKSFVRLWDVSSGCERHVLTGHEARCICLAFAPDGKRLASGDASINRKGHYEGRLRIWDAEGGKLVCEIRGTRGAIRRVVFTRDGRQVLAAADGVYVYDADTGELVGEPIQPEGSLWSLALSSDSRLLATNGHNQIWLWELASRREIPLAIPGGAGRDVDFAPNGRILAVSSQKGDIVLFDWLAEEVIGTISVGADVGSRVVFSPDGLRLATAENPESSVLIWDVSRQVNRPQAADAKPSDADLRGWWNDLSDINPRKASRAVWRFAAAPEQTLPFLTDRLRPVEAPEPASVARLIDDLDSDDFQMREKASQRLEHLGEGVAEALRAAKNRAASLEQRRRIERLLNQVAGIEPSLEPLRALRALAILEQLDGAGARRLLADLAAGAEGARLTREAKVALERLKQREKK
jgi:WD40 repeat protein